LFVVAKLGRMSKATKIVLATVAVSLVVGILLVANLALA
jgi:hypothetical protein